MRPWSDPVSPRWPTPGPSLTAERLGRVRELSTAIRDEAALRVRDHGAGAFLYLNLHPDDLEDEALYSPDSPLASFAERVVLEITERVSLDRIRDVGRRMRVLREMGFRIAVDDLGAGYAGLTSFSLLEPDVVKLDMALIRGVDRASTKQKVIRSMATLCAEMGIEMVAEGVETDDELECLVQLGCDLFQGFRFAKPAPNFPVVQF